MLLAPPLKNLFTFRTKGNEGFIKEFCAKTLSVLAVLEVIKAVYKFYCTV